MSTTYAVIDFETTGLIPSADDIIELAVVKLDHQFNEVASFNTLVQLDKRREVPEFITGLTGITTEQTEQGLHLKTAMSRLNDFIGDSIVVAQYAPFDLAFLKDKTYCEPRNFICTKSLTSLVEPLESSSLGPTCERLGIPLVGAHTAMADARATAEVLRFRAIEFEGSPPLNTLVVSPDRPLGFIPIATKKISLKGGGLIYEKK